MLSEIGTGSSAEAAALISYDNRIGLLWSDQATGSFEFASHLDGDVALTWTRETARAGPRAGDHISLRRVDGDGRHPGGRREDVTGRPGRAPGGRPHRGPRPCPRPASGRASRSAPSPTGSTTPCSGGPGRPGRCTCSPRRGDIVTKQAPLDDIGFEPGPGRLFLLGGEGRLFEPTAPRDGVGARSGVVVLASDTAAAYRHAEAPIVAAGPVADPEDRTPPDSPALLQARAESPTSVDLSWADVDDGDRWVAAQTGCPCRDTSSCATGSRSPP